MLGHRGCRLGITYPEIYEMQAAAIFEAAVEVTQEIGKPVAPEIMVPLIATKKEFDILKAIIDRVGREVMERAGVSVPYLVGTMIELPRAALRAGEIAETAEFFSFGTNDLTQTVFTTDPKVSYQLQDWAMEFDQDADQLERGDSERGGPGDPA